MARPTLPPGTRKERIAVRFDPDSLDAADRLAELLGTNRSAVIRTALAVGLAELDREHTAA
jgi:hypothetical protein